MVTRISHSISCTAQTGLCSLRITPSPRAWCSFSIFSDALWWIWNTRRVRNSYSSLRDENVSTFVYRIYSYVCCSCDSSSSCRKIKGCGRVRKTRHQITWRWNQRNYKKTLIWLVIAWAKFLATSLEIQLEMSEGVFLYPGAGSSFLCRRGRALFHGQMCLYRDHTPEPCQWYLAL